jgi:AbrB family looped-hinge helix DNA binding protein
MDTVAISKGRIKIPARICRELDIKEGTHIHIDVDSLNNKIILTPITREYIQSLRGKYKGKGLMKAFMAEKRPEKSL